jgi:hypothetical protein
LKRGKIIVTVAYFGLAYRGLVTRRDYGEKVEKAAAVRRKSMNRKRGKEKLKQKYAEGRINYFEGWKKYGRHFECRRFTVKEAHKGDS